MNIFLNSSGIQEEGSCVSKAVSLGDFVYVSGQTGKGNTIAEQTISCANALMDAIEPFGLKMHHLVKFTVYLKNLNDKKEFLDVFSKFIEPPFPSCTLIQADRLENDALLCIEALGVNTLRYEKAQKEHSCSGGCSHCDGDCQN